MQYLNKFDTTDNFKKFIYNGGTHDPYVPNVDLTYDTDNVYYSSLDEVYQNVPPGYAQLEYIENNGAAAIIMPRNYTSDYEIVVEYNETVFNNSFLLRLGQYGTGSDSKLYLYHGYYSNNNYFGIYVKDSDANSLISQTLYNPVIGDRMKVEFALANIATSPRLAANWKFIVKTWNNGTQIKNLSLTPSGDMSASGFFDGTNSIFAKTNTAGTNAVNPFYGKLYSFKMLKNNYHAISQTNITYTEYIYYPAMRLSDGKIGLIEDAATISSSIVIGSSSNITHEYQFLTSNTSVDFIGGPIVAPKLIQKNNTISNEISL